MPSEKDYEKCRTFRHFLDIVEVTEPEGNYGPLDEVAFVLRLRCASCTSYRVDEIDAEGNLVRRSYEYVPGYKIKQGDVKPELRELRLKLLKRHLGRDVVDPRVEEKI